MAGKDPEQMTLSLEAMPPHAELEQIHQVREQLLSVRSISTDHIPLHGGQKLR
jgi:hypothetical protein